jgi:hypothetical protein
VYFVDECVYVYCVEGFTEVKRDNDCSVRGCVLIEAFRYLICDLM